ncbi:MAG: methyltransferase domain-containing protein [Henriciella sp.]|uniref:class I SAM-dependent methyltransferase n=1 Tax=Henriciella sp. TaxID=1968823 RepID=UPI002638D250|nr:methyltransferase domain-containing protein [Henriciella sp.]
MDATTIRHDTTERHVAKYANKNPIHRLSLGRFHDLVAETVREVAPSSILDFGCGEGFVLDELSERGVSLKGYEGLDLREDALAAARSRWPEQRFTCANLFDGALDERRYDMVMSLEVLEHLFEPEKALERLVTLCSGKLLLTVPNEPWFQLANLARGRDFIRLGNHPEHINHWNAKTFAAFVGEHARVINVKTRFPFVILLAEPK